MSPNQPVQSHDQKLTQVVTGCLSGIFFVIVKSEGNFKVDFFSQACFVFVFHRLTYEFVQTEWEELVAQHHSSQRGLEALKV